MDTAHIALSSDGIVAIFLVGKLYYIRTQSKDGLGDAS